MGFDCGECPVVTPPSGPRPRATAGRRRTARWPACCRCLSSGSRSCRTSSTIESCDGGFEPPSVAVRPGSRTVDAMLVGEPHTSAMCAVLRAIATAAGSGWVKTPCTSSWRRRRSMLLCLSSCSSVFTFCGPRIPGAFDDGGSAQSHGWQSLCGRGACRRQWKIGKARSRTGSVESNGGRDRPTTFIRLYTSVLAAFGTKVWRGFSMCVMAVSKSG